MCLGKRTLQDNGSWLAALKRDNVELVTDPIAEIRRGRGRVRERRASLPGRRHRLRDGLPRQSLPVADGDRRSRGREALASSGGTIPAAYLGITVPNFPNLFCIYGPGTNLAHGGSLIFHSECQVRYIMGCLKALLETDRSSIECKQDVHDAYDRRLQKALEGMVWSHPSIERSWYRNAQGRVTVLSPWRLLDYWQWTQQPDLDDFVLS